MAGQALWQAQGHPSNGNIAPKLAGHDTQETNPSTERPVRTGIRTLVGVVDSPD